MTARRLILASTSRYRAELLHRLGLDFEQRAPGTIETVIAGEAPAIRAMRLATAKASDAGTDLPDALVIWPNWMAFYWKSRAPLNALRRSLRPAPAAPCISILRFACSIRATADRIPTSTLPGLNSVISMQRRSRAISNASSHWIVLAVSSATAWASVFSNASKTTTRLL